MQEVTIPGLGCRTIEKLARGIERPLRLVEQSANCVAV